jgi:hypothetical protein
MRQIDAVVPVHQHRESDMLLPELCDAIDHAVSE